MKKLVVFLAIILLMTLPSCKTSYGFEWAIGEKSSRSIDDTLAMSVLEASKTTVQFQIHNPTEITYYYGKAYYLEVMQNGEWYTLDANPVLGHTLEQLSLSPGETKKDDHAWPGELIPGRFRLIKQFYPNETQDRALNIAAEFVIE